MEIPAAWASVFFLYDLFQSQVPCSRAGSPSSHHGGLSDPVHSRGRNWLLLLLPCVSFLEAEWDQGRGRGLSTFLSSLRETPGDVRQPALFQPLIPSPQPNFLPHPTDLFSSPHVPFP